MAAKPRPRKFERRAKRRRRCNTDDCPNPAQSADCPFCAFCQPRLPMFDQAVLITTSREPVIDAGLAA
jgi:hypothetical protein